MGRLLYDTRWAGRLPPTPQRVAHDASGRAAAGCLALHRALGGHSGCVNSIEFNKEGTILVTGSDDTVVCLYDTTTWDRIAMVRTAHSANIFSAVLVPHMSNRLLLSCGLDGRTCITRLAEDGSVASKKVIHRDPALASRIVFTRDDAQTAYVSRGNGRVGVIDVRMETQVDEFCPGVLSTTKSINAVCASPVHPHLLACGTDDPFVAFVDTRKLTETNAAFLRIGTAAAMNSQGIGGMNFSQGGDRIVASYKGNDVFVYAWTDALAYSNRHRVDGNDVALYEPRDRCSQAVQLPAKQLRGRSNNLTMFKEATFYADDSVVVTGGDCGHLFLWNSRSGRLLHKVKADSDIVNGVLTHPGLPAVIACGIDHDAKVLMPQTSVRAKTPQHRFSPPNIRRRWRGEADSEGAEESDEDSMSAFGSSTDDDDDDAGGRLPTDSDEEADRDLLRAVAMDQIRVHQSIAEADLDKATEVAFLLRLLRRAAANNSAFGAAVTESDEESDDDDDDDDDEAALMANVPEASETESPGRDSDDVTDATTSAAVTTTSAEPDESTRAASSAAAPAVPSAETAEETVVSASADPSDLEHASDDDDTATDASGSDGSDDARPRTRHIDPMMSVTEPSDNEPSDDDDDDDGEVDVANLDDEGLDEHVMTLLLQHARRYAQELSKVTSFLQRNGFLGADISRPKYATATASRLSGRLETIWRMCAGIAEVVYTTLEGKRPLCRTTATLVQWRDVFVDAAVHRALFACAEGNIDQAVAFLSDASLHHPNALQPAVALVAMLRVAQRSDELLATSADRLRELVRHSTGGPTRALARRVLAQLDGGAGLVEASP